MLCDDMSCVFCFVWLKKQVNSAQTDVLDALLYQGSILKSLTTPQQPVLRYSSSDSQQGITEKCDEAKSYFKCFLVLSDVNE